MLKDYVWLVELGIVLLFIILVARLYHMEFSEWSFGVEAVIALALLGLLVMKEKIEE